MKRRFRVDKLNERGTAMAIKNLGLSGAPRSYIAWRVNRPLNDVFEVLRRLVPDYRRRSQAREDLRGSLPTEGR